MKKVVCNRAKHPGHPLENVEVRYRFITRYRAENLCERCALLMLNVPKMLFLDVSDGALKSIEDLKTGKLLDIEVLAGQRSNSSLKISEAKDEVEEDDV